MAENDKKVRASIPVVIRDIKVKHNELTDTSGHVLSNNIYSMKAQVRADVKTDAPKGVIITRPRGDVDNDYVEISEDAMHKILEVGSLNGNAISEDVVNHPEKAQELYDNGTPLLYDAFVSDGITYDCESKTHNGFKSYMDTSDLPDQSISKISFDKELHESTIAHIVKDEIQNHVTDLTKEHDDFEKSRDAEYEDYFNLNPSEIKNAGESKECLVMVTGMTVNGASMPDGTVEDVYHFDLVADVSGISDADKAIKEHDGLADEEAMHFEHLYTEASDYHYQGYFEKDAVKILKAAFDYDEYGRPIESKTDKITDWNSSTKEVKFDTDGESKELQEKVRDGMDRLPFQYRVYPFKLNDDGQFTVPKQERVKLPEVFTPKKYPEYQRETTRWMATDGSQKSGLTTGPRQPMAGQYIPPTFSATISRSADDEPNNFKIDLGSIKPYSPKTIRPKLGKDMSQYDKDPLIKYTYRYSMEDLNAKADNYNRSLKRLEDFKTADGKNSVESFHNVMMDRKSKDAISSVNQVAKELDFDVPYKMMEPLKQNYGYIRPNAREALVKPTVESSVHLDTMSGKQVGLMVNRMKTMDVMGRDGKPKSFVVVDAVKRGDLDDQHNQYDGKHVVNRKLGNGSIVHGQAISNDSAKKIMEVNGYADVDRKDYDKIASQQRLLFNANVFRPDTNKKNDYKFNPNPDVINESNVPFDRDKHQHNRAVYSTKPISKDLDAEP